MSRSSNSKKKLRAVFEDFMKLENPKANLEHAQSSGYVDKKVEKTYVSFRRAFHGKLSVVETEEDVGNN